MSCHAGFVLVFLLYVGIGCCDLLQDPHIVKSVNGVLKTTLVVSETMISLGEYQVLASVYNGMYVPPTLSVAPGDRLELLLVNNLTSNLTNVHFHGLAVSPNSPADNPFNEIVPGHQYQYNLTIPSWHQPGLYWYHSHAMGASQFQVFNGLSGAIDIQGILNTFVLDVRNITQRIFLLKDLPYLNGTIIDDQEDVEGAINIVSVNGLINGTVSISPNELQLWRFTGMGANRYWNISCDEITFNILAIDGHVRSQLNQVSSIVISPASRYEVFVRGPPMGSYQCISENFITGLTGDDWPRVDIFNLNSHGSPKFRTQLPKLGFPDIPDLRNSPIAVKRNIVLSEEAEKMKFYINGNLFNLNRVDFQVEKGTVEEWTILNNSTEMHNFHIHIVNFQVVQVENVSVYDTGRFDTINVNPMHDGVPGKVVIVIPFTQPDLEGKFMFHCHILEHEDGGMMGVIQVVSPTSTSVASSEEPVIVNNSWKIGISIFAVTVALLIGN